MILSKNIIETSQDLETLLANEETNNVEKTERLNRQFVPYYDEKGIVAGNLAAKKGYEDYIYLNQSSSSQRSSNKIDINLSTAATKKEDNEEYVYTREEGIKRANRHRTNNFQYTIRTNIDECNKFVTLSFGMPDYYTLVTGNDDKNINLKNELSAEELSALKGIKDIRRCKDGDKTKLDKKHEELRLKIIDLFLEKEDNVRTSLEKDIDKTKYKKGNKAYKRELRRKAARRINSLIANCDPNNLSEVSNELTNFIKRLRRTNLYKNELKYIGIIEVQEKTGHFHIHMICNLLHYPQYKLQQKWGNGTVDISRIYRSKNKYYQKLSKNESEFRVTQYLTKAVKKTSRDPRVKKKRQLIRPSQNLKRPHVVTDPALIREINNYLHNENISPFWKSELLGDDSNKYSVNYTITKYELPGNSLYEHLDRIAGEFLSTLLELMKSRNINKLNKEIYYEAKRLVFYSKAPGRLLNAA